MKLKTLLEDAYREKMLNFIKKTVKRKIPKAKLTRISDFAEEIVYQYKGFYFYISYSDDFQVVAVDNLPGANVVENEILKNLNSMDVKDVKKLTKEIKRGATKLPKKKLKL
jgi:hypothetical protein